MFEHYAENARRTVFFARYEAAQRGAVEITPEHILLGLVSDSETTLRGAVDIPGQQIRDEISAKLAKCETGLYSARIHFSAQTERVLAFAEKAVDNSVGEQLSNDHILLGLLCVENCFASEVLRRHGISAHNIRQQMSSLAQGERVMPQQTSNASELRVKERKLSELEGHILSLFEKKEYKSALDLVEEGVADTSLDKAQTIRMLGPIASVIAQVMGDLAVAKRFCELRATYDPNNAMALYALADCLALQGDSDRARKIARKSYELSLTPENAGRGLADLIKKRFPGIQNP